MELKSPDYPEKLKNYTNMPGQLYVKGMLPDLQKLSVAIVGARMCSTYGRIQAFRYAKAFSQAGIQIISGLAYGIDAEAHRGALEGGTPTFAVMGNGVDICYPARNRPLYERIIRTEGGIISEYPKGTRARNYFFPLRNRIISALSDAVLVVEAKENSGSLITAQYALEQGKMVYAIPGPVNEPLSKGCHKLIYDGAGIAYSPEILLAEWGMSNEKKAEDENEEEKLSPELKAIYCQLGSCPRNMEELIIKSGFAPEKVANLLMELEMLGLAEEAGRHYYVKVR